MQDWTTLALLLWPLIGAVTLLWAPKRDSRALAVIALVWTVVTFLQSLAILASFNWSAAGEIQKSVGLDWAPSLGMSFSLGLDGISLWLVMLTTFLMPLVVLGSFNAIRERAREYYIWMLILESAMLGVFLATDVLFFYLCFEFTLAPMYFLIGIWGSSKRRVASIVFFAYTFTGSMLTFAGVLFIAWYGAHYSPTGVWSFQISDLIEAGRSMPAELQVWVMLALLAGFAVKVPLFPFHTWLPLAHTEAPTGGSVVLAGVLLKLGTYGLVRLAIPMLPEAALTLGPIINGLAVAGILYAGLICWVQKDIKKLIAYSSVSHLGFCVLGMFALNAAGLNGSILYMVNHGLSTGALFLCVGMVYERLHTREMRHMGGLARVIPIWSFFFVFFCMASVGLPGLNGFVGEFLALLGAFAGATAGPIYAALAGVGMIIGAIYILYMVGKVVFGPVVTPAHEAGDDHADGDHAHSQAPDHGHAALADLNLREIVVLAPLAVACLWLGVYPAPVLDSLRDPVAAIIAPYEMSPTEPDQGPLEYVQSLDAGRTSEAGVASPSPSRLDPQALTSPTAPLEADRGDPQAFSPPITAMSGALPR